ncbi:MAG: hypothetical protein M0C28_41780 [Candidatus Moduliflexus flocculans]|nr:hypothetical protein [Candidatus Moduliflexus flocculans]
MSRRPVRRRGRLSPDSRRRHPAHGRSDPQTVRSVQGRPRGRREARQPSRSSRPPPPSAPASAKTARKPPATTPSGPGP